VTCRVHFGAASEIILRKSADPTARVGEVLRKNGNTAFSIIQDRHVSTSRPTASARCRKMKFIWRYWRPPAVCQSCLMPFYTPMIQKITPSSLPREDRCLFSNSALVDCWPRWRSSALKARQESRQESRHRESHCHSRPRTTRRFFSLRKN